MRIGHRNSHPVLLDEGGAEHNAPREVGGGGPRGVHEAAPRDGARVGECVLFSCRARTSYSIQITESVNVILVIKQRPLPFRLPTIKIVFHSYTRMRADQSLDASVAVQVLNWALFPESMV